MAPLGIHKLTHPQEALRITRERFARVIGISPSTLTRWKKDTNKVNPLAREKIELIDELVHIAADVMDTKNIADWFEETNEALGNKKPIDLIVTYQGILSVKQVLTELEWGLIG